MILSQELVQTDTIFNVDNIQDISVAGLRLIFVIRELNGNYLYYGQYGSRYHLPVSDDII